MDALSVAHGYIWHLPLLWVRGGGQMSELLFCPFCGGEAETLTAESMHGGYLFGIMCNDCRSRGDVYGTEAEAIAAWNSRVERTCKMKTDHDELEVIAYSHEDTWAYKCSACDWSFRYDRGIKPDYCPHCGARTVGE